MNSEKILCLDIIEHIRKRPGLYIADTNGGSSAEDGIYSLLREVVENAIDESRAGFGNTIDITLCDNTFLIRDYGRGIPLEALPEVVSKAFSGGKFTHAVYTRSIGMHGLGLKVVNALSESFYCKTIRDGKYRKISARYGQLTEDKSEILLDHNGCEIFFKPDPVIFADLQINTLAVEKILKGYCSANTFLQINFNGKVLKHIHGLLDFMVEVTSFETMVGEPIVLHGKDWECVLTQNQAPSAQWISFVNGHPTGNGGVHTDALKSALYKGALEMMRGEHHMKKEDVFSTVSGIIAVTIDDPLFEAQTKNRLGNAAMFKKWQNEMLEELLIYWYSNVDECELFFQQIDLNIEKRERAAETCAEK